MVLKYLGTIRENNYKIIDGPKSKKEEYVANSKANITYAACSPHMSLIELEDINVQRSYGRNC